jgi:hypothetical protein
MFGFFSKKAALEGFFDENLHVAILLKKRWSACGARAKYLI